MSQDRWDLARVECLPPQVREYVLQHEDTRCSNMVALVCNLADQIPDSAAADANPSALTEANQWMFLIDLCAPSPQA